MGFNIRTSIGFLILWGLVGCGNWNENLELVTSWHSLRYKAGRLWTHLYKAQDALGTYHCTESWWKALTLLSDRKIGLRRADTICLFWDPHLGMNSPLSMKRSWFLHFVQNLQSSWALWMPRVFAWNINVASREELHILGYFFLPVWEIFWANVQGWV